MLLLNQFVNLEIVFISTGFKRRKKDGDSSGKVRFYHSAYKTCVRRRVAICSFIVIQIYAGVFTQVPLIPQEYEDN